MELSVATRVQYFEAVRSEIDETDEGGGIHKHSRLRNRCERKRRIDGRHLHLHGRAFDMQKAYRCARSCTICQQLTFLVKSLVETDSLCVRL
jgi:hypothetical protein